MQERLHITKTIQILGNAIVTETKSEYQPVTLTSTWQSQLTETETEFRDTTQYQNKILETVRFNASYRVLNTTKAAWRFNRTGGNGGRL
jgi:hypothetical protein